jgi:hypoxia up-regulated 1
MFFIQGETGSPDEQETTTPAPSQGESTTIPPKTANLTVNGTDSVVKNATATANVTILREDIKFELVDVDLIPFTKAQLDEFKNKLSVLKEKEREKRKRAAAINSLETFIFDTKDKLIQDEFIKCSTNEEREAISSKLDEADAWLSEADDSVETKLFSEKLGDLKAVSKTVFYRLKERKLRPQRLDELKEVLNKSVEFLGNTRNLTGEDLPLTQVEWDTLDKLINTTKEWRVKMLNEQAKVADHEDPKLVSTDINDKIDNLKREVNYLVSKIKYFRPKTTKKPPTKSSKSTSDKTETSETDEQQQQQQDEQQDQQQPQGENNQEQGQENYFEDSTQNSQSNDESTTNTQEPDDSTKNPEL